MNKDDYEGKKKKKEKRKEKFVIGKGPLESTLEWERGKKESKGGKKKKKEKGQKRKGRKRVGGGRKDRSKRERWKEKIIICITKLKKNPWSSISK